MFTSLSGHRSRLNATQKTWQSWDLWVCSQELYWTTEAVQTVLWCAKFESLFKLNANLDVSVVWDHLIARTLGAGTASERDWQCIRKTAGEQPRRFDKDMDCVMEAFMSSLKKSVSQTSAQLPQMTVHRVLWQILHQKPCKLYIYSPETYSNVNQIAAYMTHECTSFGAVIS
jgi:hypothetical protein